ncbi:retron St85 family RNA-directed DNA polymerase [Streptococcus uberis]|uniref:retron St85 family RNA-directed DNA polymerase n=1 Tax=Streptococcus uberis TaxID=1349 RepID=UPI0027DCE3E9|nr:retron St85 family RNA-directed DNA polymerase [Streptococcus uberis]MCK1235663.1 retron St85 family RNA-directed DNA polymerase [Streptococcus uberis]
MSQLEESKIFDVPVFCSLEELREKIGTKKTFFYKVLYSNDKLYKEITIPKRKGGNRVLNVPTTALKVMQRWILDNILYQVQPDPSATGFIPTKSIVLNASVHLRKKYILKMDIKDFFPTIDFHKVRNLFIEIGYNLEVSTALANICIFQNQLPQGAPTSPYLANLVCRELDKRIYNLCRKYRLTYTRYADDITISGNSKIFWIKGIVEEIICSYQFTLNDEKTVFLKPGDRKRVTGIIVNEKLSVPRSVTRNLRKEIYFIKKYGLEEHLEKYNFKGSKERYISHLYGLASYIKMVELTKGIFFFKSVGLNF